MVRIFTFLLFIYLLSLSNFSFAYVPLTSDEFLENRSLIDMDLSPNGNYLASVWYVDKTNTNIVTIHDMTAEDNPIIATVNERTSLPHSVKWASNDRLIMKLSIPIFLKDAKEQLKSDPENFNIYKFRTQDISVSVNHLGKDLVQLSTKRRGELINTVRNYLPSDPNHIMMEQYLSGRRELLKVNVFTGKGETVTIGGRNTFKFITDALGHPIYRLDYLPVAKMYEVYQFIDGDWESFEKIKLKSLIDELEEDVKSFNKDLIGVNNQKLVYLKPNELTGYKELVAVDTKTKKKSVLVSLPEQDIQKVLRDRNTGEILGYRFIDKDLQRTVYFDEEKQKINEQVGKYFLQDSFRLISRSENNEHWVVKSDARNENAFYLFEPATNKLELYGHTYKKLTPDKLGIPAVVNYKARDGLKIRSYILLPPSYQQGKSYPTIILPHGGPHSRDYARYDNFAQFLATRGYLVIQPNFRGSKGYGKAFEESGYKQWGLAMQDDLEDAVNFFVNKGYAQKDKICIVGASYGGYAALMGLTKTPNLYKCGVSINGVTDIAELIEHDQEKFKNKISVLNFVDKAYGNLENDKDYLVHNSPIYHVNRIKAPVMILAGELDTVVPIEQAQSYVSKLKSASKVVEAHIVKWSGHNIFHYSNCRKQAYKQIESFLSKNLGVPIIENKSIQKEYQAAWSDKELCLHPMLAS